MLSPGPGIEAADLSSLLEQFEKSEGEDAARCPLWGLPCPCAACAPKMIVPCVVALPRGFSAFVSVLS